MMAAVELWVINQYAKRPGEPGGGRHYALAQRLRAHGVSTTIFIGRARASPHSEPMDESMPMSLFTLRENVDYAEFRVPNYASNGIARFWSMIAFSVIITFRGWFAARRGVARPDIVIGSSPHLFGAFSGWLLAKRYRVPFVLEVRDIWPLSFVSVVGLRPRHPVVLILGLMERFLYKHADLIITLLQGTDEHVQDQVGERAAPTVWIPNGVDLSTDSFVPEPSQTDPFVVTYTGAHGPANDLITLIRAAENLELRRQMNKDVPRFKFIIVGGGVTKDGLISYVCERNLRSVEFREPVPKSEILGLLQSSHALAIGLIESDLWNHGISPNKLSEYMAACRPVIMAISTRFDPVAAANAGISVPSSDADKYAVALLAIAAQSPEERRQLGANGRRYVQQFHNTEQLAETLAGELLNLLARDSDSPRRRD